MSDLHIDSNDFGQDEFETLVQVLRDQQIDHLHIAGDISNDFSEISLPFLEKLQSYTAVSINLGNHDMLKRTEEEIENYDFQVQTFGNTHLVILAGWYDYSFAPQMTVEQHIAKKNLYWFDRKLNRPLPDPDLTKQILNKPDALLAKLDSDTIVAMHFVPHSNFLIDHPYFQAFNGFLGSGKFHHLFVKHGVAHVYFGHLHRRYPATTVDGVIYHARPLGYRREWQMVSDFYEHFSQFSDYNTYHLTKHYRAIKDEPLFQTYVKNQLYKELADCLMVLEI